MWLNVPYCGRKRDVECKGPLNPQLFKTPHPSDAFSLPIPKVHILRETALNLNTDVFIGIYFPGNVLMVTDL